MYLSWEEAIDRYKGKWVIFKNPTYNDPFHMELQGGEFVGTAGTQSEMFSLIAQHNNNPADTFTFRHTEEDEAVGLILSSF